MPSSATPALPHDLEDRINAWRLEQPGIPPRDEAIRSLIELGLEAADKRGGPPHAVGPESEVRGGPEAPKQ